MTSPRFRWSPPPWPSVAAGSRASRLDGSRGIVAFTPVNEAIGGASPAVALVGVPLSEVYGPADTTFHIGLFLMAVAALLLLLGGWAVAEGMLVRPVRALVGVTRRLSGGDLSARSGPRRFPGELGELADSVDRMAEGLSSLTRQNSLLLASAEEGIVGLDTEGRVTLANPAAAEILDRPLESLVGADFHDLVHEGSIGDHTHATSDCPLLRPLTQGRPLRVADGHFHRVDGTPVPVAWTASPIRDGAKVTGVAVFFSDESGRRALEGQLRQAQKLEAVGQLAGGVAHDFNNLLTAILTCATLVKQRLPDGDQNQEDLDAILRSTDRAAGLTRQLLAFSRRDVVSPRVLVRPRDRRGPGAGAGPGPPGEHHPRHRPRRHRGAGAHGRDPPGADPPQPRGQRPGRHARRGDAPDLGGRLRGHARGPPRGRRGALRPPLRRR